MVRAAVAAADHCVAQCPTAEGMVQSIMWWPPAALLLLLAAAAGARAADMAWPPFLPARGAFPADIVAVVERTWDQVTFSRTVQGRPARAPFDLYLALVDAPDVTAAAARFRGLARHEVRALGADWYEADDRDGSHGQYRVLLREPRRRVILSWGEHSSGLIGAIRGSALTELLLEPRGAEVSQALTAHVHIDNRVAAAVARLLIVLFGGIADRRLREAFASAGQVAEWAAERPEEFCLWLDGAPVPPGRRARLRPFLPACGAAS